MTSLCQIGIPLANCACVRQDALFAASSTPADDQERKKVFMGFTVSTVIECAFHTWNLNILAPKCCNLAWLHFAGGYTKVSTIYTCICKGRFSLKELGLKEAVATHGAI